MICREFVIIINYSIRVKSVLTICLGLGISVQDMRGEAFDRRRCRRGLHTGKKIPYFS